MARSAITAALCLVALLFVSACGPPEPGVASEAAHEAWKLYLEEPGPGTYENFVRANRFAANLHAEPHDAVGVEYQLRALEVQAAEAERAGDADLAASVVERVAEIGTREHTDLYDEIVPGARARLDAAKVRAEKLSR